MYNRVGRFIEIHIKKIIYIKEIAMKKILIYSTIALALFCIPFSACSKGEDDEKEKRAIEKMTEQAAEDIVNRIQTPIDKARDAKEREEERARKIDDMAKEQ